MNRLCQRLLIVLSGPDTPDRSGYFAEVDRLLAGYTEDELEKAYGLILASHRGKSWPALSEIVTACADARVMLSPPKPADASVPGWSKESVRRAYQLVRSDMGRRAAREGWISPLWHFCRREGRLPREDQIPALQREAEAFNRAYAGLDGRSSVDRMLIRLGDSMIARREEIVQRVFGGRP